jgi:hypothetical protein
LPDWTPLLVHTITYALRNGVNASGSPTFAAQATCAALVEQHISRAEVGKGIEWKTYNHVATETELPNGTRVWLPGASTGDNNASVLVRTFKTATSPITGDTLYEYVF